MPPELFGPEDAAFGASRLLSEILIADQEIRAAGRNWINRHRWLMYRERVAGWRYLVTRGIPLHRITRCRTCDRLVRVHYNPRFRPDRKAVCFSCGQRWWVFL